MEGVDTLALFGPQETYRGAFWLYSSTKGVVGLGGECASIGEAQFALEKWSGLTLKWIEGTLTANEAWKQEENVAVVTGKDTGTVVSWAAVPAGWFPPGHPRRAA